MPHLAAIPHVRSPQAMLPAATRTRNRPTNGTTTMTKSILNVPDISCAHCRRTIIAALAPVDGIAAVAVDIPARQVRLEQDPARVDLDRVTATLADEDYPVASIAGDGGAASDQDVACACCSPRA